MAANDDKARPLQERIAALFGSGAYFDPRDGAGGTSPGSIKHQDVAAALGYVAAQQGRVAALVLETHYGSTLAHERELSKAWEASEQVPTANAQAVILTRFAGALAIRQLAGLKYNSTQYAEYAYLLFSRREALQRRVAEAGAWMEAIRSEALREFLKQLRHEAVEREKRKAQRLQQRAA